MKEAQMKDIVELIRHVVLAFDEIERDLQGLGRTPVAVRHAKESLRQLEFRLMSDAFEPELAGSFDSH